MPPRSLLPASGRAAGGAHMEMLTDSRVALRRRLRSTAVHRFVDQPPEAVDVDENQRAAPALDHALAFERLELACDGFATRADACRDFRMQRRRRDDGVRRIAAFRAR